MEIRMNRSILVCALMITASAALAAQQAGQSSDPYQGTSNPPPNDTIVSSMPPEATPAPAPAPQKPSPSHRAYAQPAQPAPALQYQAQPQPQTELQPAPASSSLRAAADGTDDGIVEIAPDPAQPNLSRRAALDPDGDIVHPALGPNEVGAGTTIRVHLLERLSTADAQDGQTFRSRVASDVVQDGQVLIPAGSEIDGTVKNVSSGGFAGHGSMRLNPETVILPDGARFRMYAQVSGTRGSNTRVGGEGSINPGSHLKRNGIEYGGAVGTGAITGAVLGGPVGALAGTIVGAGVITAHLLVNHPQASLDEGTTLLFTLSEPLNLVPTGTAGN
jgi:hypothetical protein